MDGGDTNLSKAIEDLVLGGETDKAISLLESIISGLENCAISYQSHMRKLSTAMFELANLYSIKGLSLEAERVRSRATRIQQCSLFDLVAQTDLKEFQVLGNKASAFDESTRNDDRRAAKSLTSRHNELPSGSGLYDDWKASASRAPAEIYSTVDKSCVSNISLEGTKTQSPKQRGRGPLTYKKQSFYGELEDEDVTHSLLDTESRDYWETAADSTLRTSDVSNISLKDTKTQSPMRKGRGPFTYRKQETVKYGTRHVLVLADFPSRTRREDLEKLLEAYRGHFEIRWVGEKIALAVFETPQIARAACNSLRCPFMARILEEKDYLLSSIPLNDLEPPRPRRKIEITEVRRKVGHALGVRLRSPSPESKERREQEEAR